MRHKNSISYSKYGYIFALPFFLAFTIFTLYPTIYTAMLGFTDSQGLGGMQHFNFLEEDRFSNFRFVLENQSFRAAFFNTFSIWILNFIPQMTLALLLAAWFTSRRMNIRGKGFFKILFYMPNIITAASIAILFNALFAFPISPVNSILELFGRDPVNFLTRAEASRAIVIFIQFWIWYGYTMIILIAGINGISPDLYEAGEIDGATGLQAFFRITLPNLRMVMLFLLVTSLIGGLNVFDVPRLFNNGGPASATTTLALFIFNWAFTGRYVYALASAASMIMFAVIAVISGGMFFLLRDHDEARLQKEAKKLRKHLRKVEKENRVNKRSEGVTT